jgi:predicted ABC-type ATPase
LLDEVVAGAGKPVAFVLAGHNGSGKSTLWKTRLSDRLQIPLINADRLTLSILPEPDRKRRLPTWAQRLRDEDERWQGLSQASAKALTYLVMEKRMPFAFETVFSHWQRNSDGSYQSKTDLIVELQAKGYFVVLLFVGLASADISIGRVRQRLERGGHDVPVGKLVSRYPRTQKAVGHAAPIADMTVMFDNSFDEKRAFSLVRVQTGSQVLFDCRDMAFKVDPTLRAVARAWLDKVAAFSWSPRRTSSRRARRSK